MSRLIVDETLVSAVRQRLAYDALTGKFTWIASLSPYMNGRVAGSIKCTGYRDIYLDGFGSISAHRLAWIYVNGAIPDGLSIDHIDGNKLNNSILNLRLATALQQMQNKGGKKTTKTGFKGVAYCPSYEGHKKYLACIKLNGRSKNLGRFYTAEEAGAAYATAARNAYGEFATTRLSKGASA